MKVQTEDCGSVSLIRFQTEEAGTMTPELAARLLSAFRNAESLDQTRAIVLTGTEDVFVRHFDVETIAGAARMVRSGSLSLDDFKKSPFNALIHACSVSSKPVIAAINGTCMGGGLELALACDLRIAARSCRQIGLPEIRAGLIPGAGGTVRLGRLIGSAKARQLLMLGAILDADEALASGLVHEVAEDACNRALALAGELSTRSRDSLAFIKSLCEAAFDQSVDEALDLEAEAFFQLLQGSPSLRARLDRVLASGGDLGRAP